MRHLLLAAVALATIKGHDDTKAAAKPVACELIATKHLAIEAKINGQGPYRLIFDTGSPVVLLNSKISREAKLAESTRTAPKGKATLPGQMIAKTIEIGSAKAENVPVAVLDHPTLKAIEGIAGPIDGIIGYPFFARFKTTIDYPNLQLTFEPNGYVPDDAIQSIMKAMNERGRKGAAKTIGPTCQIGLGIDKPDDHPGVRVKTVYVNGAAVAADIKIGDRLLTLDGRWTDTVDDCFRAATELVPGKSVAAVITRGGKYSIVQITPKAGF